MAVFLEQYPHLLTNVTLKKQVKDFDIALGYDVSEVFNEWCCRQLDDLTNLPPDSRTLIC